MTINPKLVPGLANAEFSTVVQTSQELVVDRTMSWDAQRLRLAQRDRGAIAGDDLVPGRRRDHWRLRSLFYLLQNPAATPTTVQVRYLRAAGAPLTKTYVLPAQFADQHLGQRRKSSRAWARRWPPPSSAR